MCTYPYEFARSNISGTRFSPQEFMIDNFKSTKHFKIPNSRRKT